MKKIEKLERVDVDFSLHQRNWKEFEKAIGKFRGAAHSKCNLNYKNPKDIPIIIHNCSYDTHFIINQLAEEFKSEVDCIGENIEKNFLHQLRKNVMTAKTITHKLRFIDSFRFMQFSLLDLVENIFGISNNTKCKSEGEKCCFLVLKNNKLDYRCKKCKKNLEKSIKELIRKFPSVYIFCNDDLNKFVLLLRKGVYPYKDMNNWKKFDKTTTN